MEFLKHTFFMISRVARSTPPLIAIFIAHLAVPGGTLYAAEITYECVENSCELTLKGKIEEGDSKKFESILLKINGDGKIARKLRLFSRGGSIHEGIQIGLHVRDSLIFVEAPTLKFHISQNAKNASSIEESRRICKAECFYYFVDLWAADDLTSTKRAVEAGLTIDGRKLKYDGDILCASACALIALGAVQRYGHVGLHHIYQANADATTYESLDQTLAEGSSDLRKYLDEIRAPASIVEKIFSTPSNDVAWVDLYPQHAFDRIFYEYIISYCDPLTEAESQMMVRIELLKRLGRYTNPETGEVTRRKPTEAEYDYLDYLNKKSEIYGKCEEDKSNEAQRHAQFK